MSSGSSRCESGVEPTRSQNSTQTCRCSASGNAFGCAISDLPQPPQKRAAAAFGKPHVVQFTANSRDRTLDSACQASLSSARIASARATSLPGSPIASRRTPADRCSRPCLIDKVQRKQLPISRQPAARGDFRIRFLLRRRLQNGTSIVASSRRDHFTRPLSLLSLHNINSTHPRIALWRFFEASRFIVAKPRSQWQ